MVPQCNRLLDEERLKANIGNAEGESKRFVTWCEVARRFVFVKNTRLGVCHFSVVK